MKKFLKGMSCMVVFAYSAVSGMDTLVIPIPSPGGEHFIQKSMDQLTVSDYERIHSNREYSIKILVSVEKFKSTLETLSFNEKRSSLIPVEIQFLNGTEKDLNFLLAGYSKLSSPLDETALGKLDSNLRAMYASSSNAGLCRNLAETYKELAESSGTRDDFIRAAFWFRMLYASGEHSSYLDEYGNMRLKAGL